MKTKLKTITYDKEADALYVYLRREKPVSTKVLSEHILIDLNSKNVPVGVEILDASKILKNKSQKKKILAFS